MESAEGAGVEAVAVGTAGGDRISIAAAERDVSLALADAERAWRSLDPHFDPADTATDRVSACSSG